jgi:hypothetical protein
MRDSYLGKKDQRGTGKRSYRYSRVGELRAVDGGDSGLVGGILFTL